MTVRGRDGAVYMALSDSVTRGTLGHLAFPNAEFAIVLFLLAPLACVMSVAWNVLVSSRETDLRAAGTKGIIIIFPIAAVYLAFELGYIEYTTRSLGFIFLGLMLASILLVRLARATFSREEILTRWT